jgi:hypothetical protein
MKMYRLFLPLLALILVACLSVVQGQYVAPTSDAAQSNASQSQFYQMLSGPASISNGQPVSIGGTYGRSWLEKYGNRDIVPNSTGLWDWGHIPLGNILQNGKLMSIGDTGNPTVLFYPAFPTSTTPILQNRTLMTSDYSGLSVADLSSPYLSMDPWTAAQIIGQPILYQNNPRD